MKTRNDIFSTSHSARMLQFKVAEAILKKESRLQRLHNWSRWGRSNNSQIIIKIPWELRNRLPKEISTGSANKRNDAS